MERVKMPYPDFVEVRRFLWHFSLTYVIIRIIMEKELIAGDSDYAAYTAGNDPSVEKKRV